MTETAHPRERHRPVLAMAAGIGIERWGASYLSPLRSICAGVPSHLGFTARVNRWVSEGGPATASPRPVDPQQGRPAGKMSGRETGTGRGESREPIGVPARVGGAR
jgi:hypothetical protein